jgi:hypothetical protein
MRSKLVRRSAKAIGETAPKRAVWRRRTAPDPGLSVPVELGGGETGDIRTVVVISQRLAREGFAAEEPPPALDAVEPGGADGNAGVRDARVVCQPVAHGTTEMARQIVGNQVQGALGKGLLERLQHGAVARRVACGRGLGQHVAIADAQGLVDPHLVGSARVIQGHFAAVAIDRPARGRGEIAWGYGAQFVDADDRRILRRVGVARDALRPFGAQSGSLLVAQRRVRRQRPPSRRKMRRT